MIKLLDPLTINQIAAGEVVERPASVVKELVENSIDAGATVITVEISKGGVELIKIIDNGSGFQLDEIEIAFLKHSTSKISTTSDLEHVLTMGFRGEALSSISSIAKVELTSKNKDSATGRRVTVSGGTITNTMDVAASQGTTFVIQDLFFNVPARKAFLKSAGVEAGRITDIIYKLALSHPNIAFKYIKDSKPIFQTRGNNNLKEVIFNIFGKEISDGTIPIQYATKDFKLEGRIGKLTLSKSNRSWELFFINGRYITNKIFNEAVEEAYKTLTMAKKFPVAILRVTMPASHLDVNVHPAKLEVRFKDSDAIKTAIINAIKQTLSEINLMPTFAEALPKSAHKKPALNIDQAKLVTPAITVDALSNELKFNNLFRKKPTLIVPEAAHVNATHGAAHATATSDAAHVTATHGAAHSNATSDAAHVNATHGAAHSNATHGAAHSNATPGAAHSNATSDAAHANATSEAAHVNATSDAAHVNATSEAAHVNATHEAAHLNATHGAAHSNATPEAAHVTATHGAAHANATSDAAHVNATHGAAHSNATLGAAHASATRGAAHANATSEAAHANATSDAPHAHTLFMPPLATLIFEPAHVNAISDAAHVTATSDAAHVTATSGAAHVNATSDAAHVTATSDAAHVTATSDAAHVTTTSDAAHVTATSDAAHVNATSDAAHVNATSDAAHVNATHGAAHVTATHGAAHSNATHGAAHVNATHGAAHSNATHGAAHVNATHGAAHSNATSDAAYATANARSVDYTALVKNTFEYVADSADAAYTVTAAPKNTVAIPQEGLDYFLLGQIFETYWMIKYMDKVLIMDQHAAHERVIYEKLLAEFHSNTVDSQQLLCPMIFRPTANTLPLIAAHFALLEKAGFEIEMLNEITMIIRGVPFLFNQPMAQSQVKSFLEDFGNNKGISLPEEKIIRMACKAAIKGNHKISKTECKNLIESLLVLENPFSCPHGRPTLISLEKSDIEKLFRRIV
ncbi:DNA mismatch repair endonuclease MutL [Candidatus Epulonipiscium viviparus]|uniref:DNA mismatch repair endonuclease MutL n=1 Tax=Candidatus Epulonipiscium viviparus TaxID=420336 RepID=UPI00273814C0|nr:DNA mismatch repair endonuclease MutL [Candidatus Epulopiscium viviparus]